MSAAEVLQAARAAGVTVGIDGDDLLLEAPTPPPSAVLEALSSHKAGIVAMLQPSNSRWARKDSRCADQELSTNEYDRKISQSWPQARARLDPARPPRDIPATRWLRFIDDCGRFHDEGWATSAEAIGWGPLDLFGCDRIRPFARIDRAGLLWFLNGQKVLALAENAAAISTSSGGSLTFRRSPNGPGRVLAWDLEP
jgi:hypothetical protein